MTKLSTDKIRDMIQGWVSQITEDDLAEIYDPEEFEDGLDQVIKDFSNANNWKRHSKSTLKGQSDEYFHASYNDLHFPVDFLGGYDEDLCKEMINNKARAEKCVCRVFSPKVDPLQDNFAMVVITTPEDDRVVGWTVTVD